MKYPKASSRVTGTRTHTEVSTHTPDPESLMTALLTSSPGLLERVSEEDIMRISMVHVELAMTLVGETLKDRHAETVAQKWADYLGDESYALA